jgi:hypothetical protein
MTQQDMVLQDLLLQAFLLDLDCMVMLGDYYFEFWTLTFEFGQCTARLVWPLGGSVKIGLNTESTVHFQG